MPHASAIPARLDLRPDAGCPYLSPLCDQPLYAGAQPLLINVTVLNSRSATARFVGSPLWRPRAGGHAIRLAFAYGAAVAGGELRAWRGFVGVHVSVPNSAAGWEGEVEGDIVLTIVDTVAAGSGAARLPEKRNGSSASHDASLDASFAGWRSRGTQGLQAGSTHALVLPLRARVVATPHRRRRLLLDTFHSSSYPNGFFPNDDLAQVYGVGVGVRERRSSV
jgi:membrane-bound transcription factor site-1 protease